MGDMITGVTGFFCSGKDTMAEFLQQKGFKHVSLSDIIREELRSRGLKVNIPNLTRVGNQLRRDHGSGVLAERALRQIDHARNWVVTSIRHPVEVETLRTRPDFVMVFVDAPQKTRYERSTGRARRGDPVSFKEFKAEETRQMRAKDGDPAAQALAATRELADVRIQNGRSLESFQTRIEKFIQKGMFDYCLPRPDWDEYFMMVADVASMRANCVKRRVGAVIVQDCQIHATGYNGTPRGIRNCNEGGCPRCAGNAPSGTGLGECLCVHAEENSILQAAAYGVRIRGATMYCTLCPCSYCAKSIINAGIREVVYGASYRADEVSLKLFSEAGVKCRTRKDPAISVSPVFHGKKRDC
jgi:dCMP deaminase